MFLCLLIAIPGIKFAKQLETYKVKRELLAEYAEKRIRVIGNLWTQSYEYENICHDIIENTLEKTAREWKGNRQDLAGNIQIKISPQIEQLKKHRGEIFDELDAHRSLIGEDLYKRFYEFVLNQQLIIIAKMLHDEKGLKELESKIMLAQEDIFRYVDDL